MSICRTRMERGPCLSNWIKPKRQVHIHKVIPELFHSQKVHHAQLALSWHLQAIITKARTCVNNVAEALIREANLGSDHKSTGQGRIPFFPSSISSKWPGTRLTEELPTVLHRQEHVQRFKLHGCKGRKSSLSLQAVPVFATRNAPAKGIAVQNDVRGIWFSHCSNVFTDSVSVPKSVAWWLTEMTANTTFN